MKEKTRNALLKKWGQPKNRNFNFDLIRQFADYQDNSNATQLSEKTLVDLDFLSYFKFVDRTSSAIGQQFLYYQLIQQTSTSGHLKTQEDLVAFYNSNLNHKIMSQAILDKSSRTNDYYFPYLIYSELPKKLYNSWLIACLQIATIVAFFLSFQFPAALLFIILIFTINLCLHYFHKNRIGNFTVYFSRLSNLSKAIKKLLPLSNFDENKKAELLEDSKHIDNISSKILFLKTDNLQNSEFGAFFWFVFELIKIISLSEISVFNKLVNKIGSSRPQIKKVYSAIGEIDVAISICSLRDGLPYYSIPNFSQPSKEFKTKGLYHPLVKACIPNDLELMNKSLLLTGSNMAGKSTFIKAINLNVLSAQVLNTTFTNYYSAPIWQLKTSMTIKDKLDDNSSYYMEEVNSIGELINCSKEKDRLYLFTIDEIFKGTNTIERISTAKAILEFINQNKHLVLVSTHDIELTKLLQAGFDLHFFQESINNKALSFDYKIKKGSLERSNAINILELVGYPETIIEEAKRLAHRIQKEKTGLN